MLTRSFAFIAILTSLTLLCLNAVCASDIEAKNILIKGTYELNGSANFFSDENGTSVSISPSVGYFFYDRLSFNTGATATLLNSKVRARAELGTTYYFALQTKLAPFVAQHFSTNFDSGKSIYSGRTSLGVLYFLTENVALKTMADVSYRLSSGSAKPNYVITSGLSFFF